LVLVVSCRTPPPESPRRSDESTLVRAEGPGEALYDRRDVASSRTRLESQILALLRSTTDRLRRPALETDRAVQSAATEICRGLLPSGAPPAALIELALRTNGLVDPPPHLVVADATPETEEELVRQLADRFARILKPSRFQRVGVGVATPRILRPIRRRLVVAFFESNVRFRPFPRVLAIGQSARLEFTTVAPFRGPKLIVADPAGRIDSRPLVRRGSAQTATLACQRVGVYQVEITGEGDHGSEVLANFPVHCGQAAPVEARLEISSLGDRSVEALERDLFVRTNDARRVLGLAPLRANTAVTKVARAHSEDMRRGHFVGHVSPTTGAPADRLRRAGVVNLVARENVARAYSTSEAVVELMKSPAHRSNILATDVAELGVGISVERGGAAPVLFVTQNFIRPGTTFVQKRAVTDLQRIIDAARRSAGRSGLALDGDLSRLAQSHLQRTLRDGKQQPADQELERALRGLGGRFRQVDGLLVRTGVIDAVGGAPELRRPQLTHLGVAAQRVTEGQIAIFVLLGIAR
jgi:uncharacterized protein YkwD